MSESSLVRLGLKVDAAFDLAVRVQKVGAIFHGDLLAHARESTSVALSGDRHSTKVGIQTRKSLFRFPCNSRPGKRERPATYQVRASRRQPSRNADAEHRRPRASAVAQRRKAPPLL